MRLSNYKNSPYISAFLIFQWPIRPSIIQSETHSRVIQLRMDMVKNTSETWGSSSRGSVSRWPFRSAEKHDNTLDAVVVLT